jgi:hypothetical protein
VRCTPTCALCGGRLLSGAVIAACLVCSTIFQISALFMCVRVRACLGIRVVLLQMDREDPTVCLIAHFGHCSQELLNLCLSGTATPHVFDGYVCPAAVWGAYRPSQLAVRWAPTELAGLRQAPKPCPAAGHRFSRSVFACYGFGAACGVCGISLAPVLCVG